MKKLGIILTITAALILTACQSKDKNVDAPKDEIINTDDKNNGDSDVAAPDDTADTSEGNEEGHGADTAETTNLLDSLTDEVLDANFGKYKAAAFVISDGEKNVVYNEAFAAEPKSPYSTFKIPNSLIALETGVITKDNSVRKWDGEERWMAEWNQDLDLPTAFEFSAVWYYKELAKEIGAENYERYLEQIAYGNNDISGGIDEYWLGSSLKISPLEQVDFIKRLYNNEFNMNQDNVDTVKSIMKVKNTELNLYGKTGSSGDGMAWFVGFLEHEEKPYYFALYVEDNKGTDGPSLKEHLKVMFADLTKPAEE